MFRPVSRAVGFYAVAMGLLLIGACGDSESSDGDGGNATSNDGGGGTGNTGGAASMGGAGGSASLGGFGGGGMCIAFGEPCEMGDTCCDVVGETGECFPFGMGTKCTIPCPANPDDCPAGEGCNNQSPPKCKTS